MHTSFYDVDGFEGRDQKHSFLHVFSSTCVHKKRRRQTKPNHKAKEQGWVDDDDDRRNLGKWKSKAVAQHHC